jgi:2-oxoglutarate ferredoxin oxidoreductase subunit alpha
MGRAFDLAEVSHDQHGDPGWLIGQMMEPITLPEMKPVQRRDWDWATNGRMGKRERRVLTSIYLDPIEEEVTNLRLMSRWKQVQANEVRYKEYFLDDAEYVIIGFGTAGRVALSAVRQARQKGLKIICSADHRSPFPTPRSSSWFKGSRLPGG